MTCCDMCGYEGAVYDAVVEGSFLTLCKRCSSFGDAVTLKETKPALRTVQRVPRKSVTDDVKDVIVENYARLIKQAREAQGLKQEELASAIKERVSVIHKLESNHLVPPLLLARKLEKYFRIRLVENYHKQPQTTVNLQDKNLTIGDLIKIKKEDA